MLDLECVDDHTSRLVSLQLVIERVGMADADYRCSVYLLWYAAFGPGLTGGASLTTTIFAAYALTEVVFAMYHYYLVHHVQAPAPPSDLPLDLRNALFNKVLHAGLSFPAFETPSFVSSFHDTGYFGDHDQYESMSPTSTKKVREREYEESVGIRQRRRVGKLGEEERSVLDAFIEENEGDRNKRLKREIETGLTEAQENEQDKESLEDSYGNPIMLHSHDRRAIEFRERLRTW